jgi:hypothetical protein
MDRNTFEGNSTVGFGRQDAYIYIIPVMGITPIMRDKKLYGTRYVGVIDTYMIPT